MTTPSQPLDLAAGLLDASAVRLSPKAPFTWASGLKAPIYCDNRQLLGFPALRAGIADALAGLAGRLEPSLIAGTSTAGPLACATSTPPAIVPTFTVPAPSSRCFRRRNCAA